jgi:hypothetical protein
MKILFDMSVLSIPESARNDLRRALLKRSACLTFLIVLFFVTATGYAQTFSGSIGGTAKDASGALVPSVAVTVRESDTATEYKTVTNSSGAYHVAFLKPGGYTVRFEANGFSLYTTR